MTKTNSSIPVEAKSIFTLIDDRTGKRVVSVTRWNTGSFAPYYHPKQFEDADDTTLQMYRVIDAMTVLANTTELDRECAISKVDTELEDDADSLAFTENLVPFHVMEKAIKEAQNSDVPEDGG